MAVEAVTPAGGQRAAPKDIIGAFVPTVSFGSTGGEWTYSTTTHVAPPTPLPDARHDAAPPAIPAAPTLPALVGSVGTPPEVPSAVMPVAPAVNVAMKGVPAAPVTAAKGPPAAGPAAGPSGPMTASYGGEGEGCDCEPLPTVHIQAIDPTASRWQTVISSSQYSTDDPRYYTRFADRGTSTGAFEVWRGGSLRDDLTVSYTADGTAVPGEDYEPLSGTVTIKAGERSAGILVTPKLEPEMEGLAAVLVMLDRSFDYNLSSKLFDVAATVTIGEWEEHWSESENGLSPGSNPPDVVLLPGDWNTAELPGTTSTGCILLDRWTGYGSLDPLIDAVSITAKINDASTATAGKDYEVQLSTASLASGQFLAPIKLTPIDDGLMEGAEVVTIEASGYVSAFLIWDNEHPNSAPMAADDEYEASWNSRAELPNQLDGKNVVANDWDFEEDGIYALLDGTAPKHAAEFTLRCDGSFTYIPELGYTGDDVFHYTVSDGELTGKATVTIHVVNHAPVGKGDTYSMFQDERLAIGGDGGVLLNDIDPDGDELDVKCIQGPEYAQVFELRSDGSFDYKFRDDLPANFHDTFKYATTDGHLQSAIVTVVLTLLAPQPSANAFVKVATFVNSSGRYITSDNSEPYSGRQWIDLNGDGVIAGAEERAYPALYQTGDKPELSFVSIANLNVQNFNKDTARIRGVATLANGDKLTVEAQKCSTVTLNGVTVMNFTGLKPGADCATFGKIAKYENLAFQWSVEPNEKDDYVNVPLPTKNTVYVVAGFLTETTKIDREKHIYYQTSVAIGVAQLTGRDRSFKNSTDDDIKTAIGTMFAPFATLNVKTWDGQRLYYYKSWRTQNRLVKSFLQRSGNNWLLDGQCNAWAALFANVVRCQGAVPETTTEIAGVESKVKGEFMFVDNWKLGEVRTAKLVNLVQYDCANKLTSSTGEAPFLDSTHNQYVWATDPPPQLTDDDGIPGQGTGNPASLFLGHQLVEYFGTFYDPSYGRVYQSLNDIQQGIHYFGIKLRDTLYIRRAAGTDELAKTNFKPPRA